MNKIVMMAVAAALCGCEKEINVEEFADEQTGEVVVSGPSKKFTFTVKGDFGNAVFVDGGDEDWGARRAAKYLESSGNEMTDLWVFDFVGDACVQTIHQTTSDDAWGHPALSLAYGSHHVYFVASRGTEPTVNATAKTISWTKPSDTFWKDYEVDVVSSSNGNRAVTLDRVVTKLKVTIADEIPADMSSLTLTPATWYYGLNYQTGEPSNASSDQARTVTVPTSYIGTTGTLAMSVFGFSSSAEWTTDVTVTAKDGTSATIGSASITGAAFKRNRATEYLGPLFGTAGSATVSVDYSWLESLVCTW